MSHVCCDFQKTQHTVITSRDFGFSKLNFVVGAVKTTETEGAHLHIEHTCAVDSVMWRFPTYFSAYA